MTTGVNGTSERVRVSGPKDVWDEFLGETARAVVPDGREVFAGRCVLVTGAGGTIGSALARAIAVMRPARLVLVDSAELGLYALDQELACGRAADGLETGLASGLEPGMGSGRGSGLGSGPGPDRVLLLGSVADERFVREVFREYRPEIVFHAAALKHVPLLETNAIAAAETNVLGTATIAACAAAAGARRLVHLSTDKAADPVSVLGATKRMAERVVLAGSGATRMAAVRLPNVLGSSGSVGPLFLAQIASGRALTVTDPEVTRYFFSTTQAVGALLDAARVDATGLLVPEVGASRRVVELARFLAQRAGQSEPEIVFTGLRAGDKLHEQMVARSEGRGERIEGTSLMEARGPALGAGVLERALAEIRGAVAARDRAGVLAALRDAVPEYADAREAAVLAMPGEGAR